MTDKIEVPRELLEELRDCANECFSYESTLSYSRSTRVNFYEALIEQCDALLREAAQPEQDGVCPHCGSHPDDLTVAWMDGAHCAKAETIPRLQGAQVMKLTFGKFKGMEVSEVLEIEPSYIAWAVRKGLIAVDQKSINKALNAHYEEQCAMEAMFESEHGDWGDR